MTRLIIVLMCLSVECFAENTSIGFFLVTDDASIKSSTLSEWHNAAGFRFKKSSQSLTVIFDRASLQSNLKYTKLDTPDACVRSDACVRKVAKSLSFEGIIIATLFITDHRYQIGCRYVHADEQQESVFVRTSYSVSNMMEEIATAVATLSNDMIAEKRGTLVLNRADSVSVLLNSTPVTSDTLQLKVGTYKLEAYEQGYVSYRSVIHIVEGEVLHETITLEKEEVARGHDADQEQPRRAIVGVSEIQTIDVPTSQHEAYVIGAWSTTGLTVAAFATAATFTVLGKKIQDKAEQCSEEFCPDFVGTTYTDAQDDAKRDSYIANAMWAIGSASAISAITLWVLTAFDADEPPSVSIMPTENGGMILSRF